MNPAAGEALRFYSFLPAQKSFLEEILAGLARPQKYIPAKFFYDARGSELFDAICELPEYYLTRTETALMQAHAAEMARALGPACLLIEYGSGASRKTRLLLDHLAPLAYMPIDIAEEQLRASAQALAQSYPGMQVLAVCADYSQPLNLPASDAPGIRRKAVYFPGSTIGNFTPEEAVVFLRQARTAAGPGGAMLVGVDLKKPNAILHAAYNDAQGVTAQFNLNLLTRINRELGGDFNPEHFRHQAFHNETAGRIEMHLQSLRAQQVTIQGRRLVFRAGETIHTENSYKYSVAEFQDMARQAGFAPRRVWSDAQQYFAVHYLTVE
ncbi:MAG: L-histidine N(alpha)-methyltransferase [Burkholderiales bacterium]